MAIETILEATSSIPYKTIFLVLMGAKYLFENYLKLRQYRRVSADRPIPKELKELNIEEEQFKSSNKYTKAKMEFGFVSELFSVALETFLLVVNYWALLWDKILGLLVKLHLDSTNEYCAMFFFVVFEIIRSTIVDIPFSYYASFVLEEKFGFNNKTKTIFITDLIKSFILQIVFIPLLLSLVLLAINYGGNYFYISAEIICIIISFVAMWVYPNFIMPLFNKMTELEEGEIRTQLYKLADKIQFPLKKIYVIDSSIRTSHSNAALFGFGNNKRIILFDTLVQKLSPTEIEAVLGHELGHWHFSHTIKKMIFSFTEIFGMLYLFKFFMHNDQMFVDFGFSTTSTFIGLALFFQIFSPISYILEIIGIRMTRRFEFQADSFTIEHGLDKYLQEGLKKLFEKNLGDMDPDPLYSSFYHDHPSFIERIKALEQLRKKKE